MDSQRILIWKMKTLIKFINTKKLAYLFSVNNKLESKNKRDKNIMLKLDSKMKIISYRQSNFD